jgi:predicted ATP-dependent serine protease
MCQCLQPIPSISLAVAAAWTSLLLRKPLPRRSGWISEVGIEGYLSETPLTADLLDSARRFGLKQLITSR